MSAAIRAGLARGIIELRHGLADFQEWAFNLIVIGSLVVVLWFQRDSTVEGTTLPLAALTLPSLAGLMIAYGGFLAMSSSLAYDREDGTLLRAKATPNGIVGYLVSRIVYTAATALITIVVMLAAGRIIVDDLTVDWLVLAWVVVLGLASVLPWGAMIGARTRSSASSTGLTFLILGGLVGISGIFYPVTAMPGWLQAVAQVFPMYWLGHGVRAALLPDAAAAAELGGEWRLWQAAGVIGAWAVAGMLLAPAVLRRMARRESGSTVQASKQRIMSRGY
ncbi:ABC transporter permease [Virgisporangium ochraceum]|uniref:Transport permease protein n=1 Tax=Virgisporangium ochraceum TaxID=65505 RepID=A0A8J3ZXI4_9ACTN|nr:ABC transporter permease [Virgisporangium ochraceum]GIJ71927.1 transport permease protein [Virgisporangium ochraceum]